LYAATLWTARVFHRQDVSQDTRLAARTGRASAAGRAARRRTGPSWRRPRNCWPNAVSAGCRWRRWPPAPGWARPPSTAAGVPADTDPDVVLDLLFGSAYHRLLQGHRPLTDQFARRVADLIVAGVTAAPDPG